MASSNPKALFYISETSLIFWDTLRINIIDLQIVLLIVFETSNSVKVLFIYLTLLSAILKFYLDVAGRDLPFS